VYKTRLVSAAHSLCSGTAATVYKSADKLKEKWTKTTVTSSTQQKHGQQNIVICQMQVKQKQLPGHSG
jgi:hypothetical protein